jgi:hypothetical protein
MLAEVVVAPTYGFQGFTRGTGARTRFGCRAVRWRLRRGATSTFSTTRMLRGEPLERSEGNVAPGADDGSLV